MQLLKDNGIISFILPKSFLNCLYYDKTRKYIYENFTILSIIETTAGYIDTEQKTIIFTFQNKKDYEKNNCSFVLEISNFAIFSTEKNINIIKNLLKNSKTLECLGFDTKIGNVVWNQSKNILTDDKNKTLLVYSSDITNHQLDIKPYKNRYKKNYIDKKGFTEPLLVVNRGYGVGKYNLNYCIIDIKKEYLIENHLICVFYTKKNR